jgi:hypothetical protein
MPTTKASKAGKCNQSSRGLNNARIGSQLHSERAEKHTLMSAKHSGTTSIRCKRWLMARGGETCIAAVDCSTLTNGKNSMKAKRFASKSSDLENS